MLETILTSLLSGSLAQRANSTIIALPAGTTGVESIKDALCAHYGTEAHPDLMMLTDDTIKVDTIRGLTGFLQSSPAGKMKTLWIANADKMNTQAANAFLKSLEEPTGSTRIILSTDNPSALLPTIRSRCALYSAITDKKLMAKEMEAAGVEAKQMAEAIKLGGGNVRAAIELATVKGAMAWAKKLEPWFLGKDRPALPPTGKTGLSPIVCALTFQAAMTRAVHTRKTDDLLKAADTWLKQNTDINRPGLDIKTRVLAWHHIFEKA